MGGGSLSWSLFCVWRGGKGTCAVPCPAIGTSLLQDKDKCPTHSLLDSNLGAREAGLSG